MGSLLLAAGEKGKRHCLPNASIMIHRSSPALFPRGLSGCLLICHTEPSGGASGQASDIAIHAKEILRIRQVLTGIYQKHCAKPDEIEAEGLARFGQFPRYLMQILTH
jgi:ATP-dependent Clp protease protease subunit